MLDDRHGKKNICIVGFVLVIVMTLSITVWAGDEISQNNKYTNRVAVISFQSYNPSEEGTVFCPICGVGSSGGKIVEGSEKIVEKIFINKLNTVKGVGLIPYDKVQSVYKRITAESIKGMSIDNLKKLGAEVGADFVVTGFVYKYLERVGYKYSAERPASVVFEIHMIRTNDGSVVWRGFFDKTQKSLMENVYQISSFFKGGAQWVTAHQLTELGMDEVFKTFPVFEK